jgi:hypothetical protein
MAYELIEAENGKQLAFLDLAWPDGLQPGLSDPVCVLIDEDKAVEDAASVAGFRTFSSIRAFRRYVNEEILHGEFKSDDPEENFE